MTPEQQERFNQRADAAAEHGRKLTELPQWKQFIRAEDLLQLQANHREQLPLKGTRREQDYKPVVKLFSPAGAATWLLTECDDDGIAFGLCDLGMGEPELGSVDLDEVFSVLLWGCIRIEQDWHFKAEKPLSEYAADARRFRRIDA